MIILYRPRRRVPQPPLLADELPRLGLEEAAVWPSAPRWTRQPSPILWTDGDELPQLGVEEDVWQAPPPWRLQPPPLLWANGDELPALPGGLGVEDEAAWPSALCWAHQPPRVLWGDDDVLPPLPIFGLDDEAGWAPAQRWQAQPPAFLWVDDDGLPLLEFEEDAWQAPPPWGGVWRLFAAWPDEESLPQLGLEEDVPWQPAPRWPGWHRGMLWTEDSDGLALLFGFLGEDAYRALRPWTQAPLPVVWYGEEEYPTPALPFFLDEDAWSHRIVWPLWMVVLGQQGWREGSESERLTATIFQPVWTFAATVRQFVFPATQRGSA